MSNKNWIEDGSIEETAPLAADSRSLSEGFHRYLRNHLGHFMGFVPFYLYEALALTVRDRIMYRWHQTWKSHHKPYTRKAYYLSLEFLIGRALGNHLLNLHMKRETAEALMQYAVDLEDVIDEEPDAGLGNGGLGRLAACFMDSCATLDLPVVGYGLRYEYGMFHQRIDNGYQLEEPDHWLRDGNPWEVARPEFEQTIHFGGHTKHYRDQDGVERVRWADTHDVVAIPYDLPISGYRNDVVNTLRLWKSTASEVFDLDDFNKGSYAEAVEAKNDAEHITMVLYPNDASESGKELRLKQQYLLASASLKDVVRKWEVAHGPSYDEFADYNVFQMNDTHPTIAVVELMRILMDEKMLSWEQAWDITSRTMAYTNHTLLPEALETWPVRLMERLLPRLMEIVYQINKFHMHDIAMKWPGDRDRQARMSLIDESGDRAVRMAYLALVGSFSVNGVAALHSKLLSEGLFRDFYELWPHKFNNKTNGVTPRRWIAYANPKMTELISQHIGDDWIRDLSKIEALQPMTGDGYEDFRQQWHSVKQHNKQRLAELIKRECDVDFDTAALFDVQVKRIHEYKRQLLNILHVVHLYNRIKQGGVEDWTPRCVLFGGKAAPGYHMAKLIIKLINNVAKVINSDIDVGSILKVAFLHDYNVSKMEIIAPATDLSEQISTAGKEASGTGNMKFMMNGAITIGTYDGANIEILEAVGDDNFYQFGLKADEVEQRRHDYQPQQIIDEDPDLQAVIFLLESGHFNLFEPGIFNDILASIKSPHDPWLTLADFRSFIDAQQEVSSAYLDRDRWLRMSIMNTACSGFFSTDRTMQEYNDNIWKLKPRYEC
ncbi:MAG: glycogen/starch/alpha-glucan phosphorylase [Gammaproteobacteria bacterium]|nr:glycogen/starch/alpha-glucan phosphorylase [Gammaproteobacteria bacterium]